MMASFLRRFFHPATCSPADQVIPSAIARNPTDDETPIDLEGETGHCLDSCSDASDEYSDEIVHPADSIRAQTPSETTDKGDHGIGQL